MNRAHEGNTENDSRASVNAEGDEEIGCMMEGTSASTFDADCSGDRDDVIQVESAVVESVQSCTTLAVENTTTREEKEGKQEDQEQDSVSYHSAASEDGGGGGDDDEMRRQKERICNLAAMDASIEDATDAPTRRRPRMSRESSLEFMRQRESISEWQEFLQSNGQSSSGNDHSEHTDSEDETLLMIAKKRAAFGGEDGGDIAAAKEQDDTTRRRQAKKEPLRPGAYSLAPGNALRRVSTFEKDAFVAQRQVSTEISDTAAARPSRERTADSRSGKKSPQRRHARSRRIQKFQKGAREQQEGQNLNLDLKPAAKKDPPSLKKSYTTEVCTSKGNVLSEEAPPEEPRVRAKSMSKVPNRTRRRLSPLVGFRRQRTNQPNGAFRSSGTMSSYSRSSGDSVERASIRLSMLAQSICSLGTDSLDDSNNSAFDRSSQMISDLAEQSVNNFMKTCQNLESLPIAAMVVPSEEDLETLIRSRLQAELQSHLAEELQNFREKLVQGILHQGQVQVADPVVEEYYGDGQCYPSLLEQFQEEESGDDSSSSSISQSGRDQVMDLEAPAAAPVRRMPMLGDDFRRSIRQSIRMEFGNLEEELDVEQAQIVTSVRSTAGLGINRNGGSVQDEQHPDGDRHPPVEKAALLEGNKDKQFIFTPRGLLIGVFTVFLMGALVGTGASILTLQSME